MQNIASHSIYDDMGNVLVYPITPRPVIHQITQPGPNYRRFTTFLSDTDYTILQIANGFIKGSSHQ